MSDIPKHFKVAISTMKETSYDEDHKEYMTKSEVEVFNFDTLKDWYSESIGGRDNKLNLKSNDALFHKDGHFTFIEFKNGDVHRSGPRKELQQKIYDSFVILCDPVTEADKVLENFEGNASYFRKNIDYILVYNESKNKSCKSSKKFIWDRLDEKAKNPRFGLAYFKGYLFRNVYTYTEQEFEERFISNVSANN